MVLSAGERRLVAKLRTPAQVQRWLREIDYNFSHKTMRSFRGVYAHKSAHCLEGALAAAFLLEHHGYPPLLLDLESQDQLDHVVFVYRAKNGKWGAVGKSRYPALMGRKPAYRTLRDLAWSYVDPFVDRTGRVTGWAVYDLRDHEGGPDWRYDPGNVWRIERTLLDIPHAPLRASPSRHRLWKRRYLAWKREHDEAAATRRREKPPLSTSRTAVRRRRGPQDASSEPPRSFYPDGARMR